MLRAIFFRFDTTIYRHAVNRFANKPSTKDLKPSTNVHVRTKRHNKLMKIKVCGNCGSTTDVREIIWGMPEGEPDPSKYLIGGCIVTDNDLTHECIECGWQRRDKKKNPLGFSL